MVAHQSDPQSVKIDKYFGKFLGVQFCNCFTCQVIQSRAVQCYSLLQRLVEQKSKSKVGWRSNAGGRVEGVNQPFCGFQHVSTNKTCDLHSKLIAEPADSAVSNSTHGSNGVVCS